MKTKIKKNSSEQSERITIAEAKSRGDKLRAEAVESRKIAQEHLDGIDALVTKEKERAAFDAIDALVTKEKKEIAFHLQNAHACDLLADALMAEATSRN